MLFWKVIQLMEVDGRITLKILINKKNFRPKKKKKREREKEKSLEDIICKCHKTSRGQLH